MEFPSIKPTTRSFSLGDYPSKTYRSLSGAIFKRAFGNRQTGYTLDLTFRNIGDTSELRTHSGTTKAIMDHYTDVDGTFESFSLPERVFEGVGSGVRDLVQSPTNVSWRYAQPPQVQSVKSGISSVTVKLVGEIEA